MSSVSVGRRPKVEMTMRIEFEERKEEKWNRSSSGDDQNQQIYTPHRVEFDISYTLSIVKKRIRNFLETRGVMD